MVLKMFCWELKANGDHMSLVYKVFVDFFSFFNEIENALFHWFLFTYLSFKIIFFHYAFMSAIERMSKHKEKRQNNEQNQNKAKQKNVKSKWQL